MPASTAIRPTNMMSQPRIRDPHQDRPFACPVPMCGGRFHRKFTLHEHMKTHTGEQPHQCPIQSCGKRFSTSGNLARHKRLHSLQRMECPVAGCTRIFTSKDMLAKHQKVHNGNAIHTCVVEGCGKTFSTAGNLTRHMKTQHRSVPLPANARSSRQQHYQQTKQQTAKVVSPTMAMQSPCDEFPVLDYDMMMFLAPVDEQLQQFSFLNTPTDPQALSDQDLKDLLECLF
ncbi:Zinc finger protein 76 [Phytophthora nicotianae]|uniref:Zinc finger protein 76 n=1 Tax=Phytophthora nicotianae TaxID=4792 RepID=A0A0W8CSL5_PHYNI|nr:Zinc finger protein 76 [Phytophthora nicotianae]KUF87016.1 hypothetical protein AM588_10001357 [Phytophthora nicotianae]